MYRMKISILCSSKNHPVNFFIEQWMEKYILLGHEVNIFRYKKDLPGGDLLFLISCSEVIDITVRERYKKSLVIHASDLPDGRGWSPHVWQVIEGKDRITVSLLEAKDKVDSGDIWHKEMVSIPKTALYDEINEVIFCAEMSLMDFAVKNFMTVEPKKQASSDNCRYYSKRSPKDSELNPNSSITDQFNLIRTCDPNRFPAFFILDGVKYKLTLEKVDYEEND